MTYEQPYFVGIGRASPNLLRPKMTAHEYLRSLDEGPRRAGRLYQRELEREFIEKHLIARWSRVATRLGGKHP